MIQREKQINKNLRIAVQMDSLDKINKETDSTLAIIEEACRRNHEVYIYNVDNLSVENNKPVASANKVLSVNSKKDNFFNLSNIKTISLDTFNIVLIRQDPPFDMQYITATYILEMLKSSCIVLNNPKSIRDCPEKLFVMNFPHLMPPTLISREKSKINKFIKKYKKVVVKPLYGNGGSDVYYLSQKDPNIKIVISNLLRNREHIIVQKFLQKVKKGDKRVLLINGEPVGAVNRVPIKNEIRANLHIGGKAVKTKLNDRERYICKQIKEKIREKGLFFSGIDIIDGYLTEINVTSPTCIREIDNFNNSNIAGLFWDEVSKIN